MQRRRAALTIPQLPRRSSLWVSALKCGVGGIIGAFAGYEIRRRLVSALNVKDIFIALLEDVVTIGLACLFVTR